MDDKFWHDMNPGEKRRWALFQIGVCSSLSVKTMAEVIADADALIAYVNGQPSQSFDVAA